MATKDFTTSILVDQSPEEVFNIITHVKEWWSQGIEGSSEKLHDKFSHHYQDIHQCYMEVSELVPGKKIVWHVTDNYFSFVKDKSEWKDTHIIFDISHHGDKTKVQFTHQGLVPAYECYDLCSSTWTDYIHQSLFKLITTGKGKPTSKKESRGKK